MIRPSVENLMEGWSSKRTAKARIKTSIQTVVNHYEGEIDEWDFNNELWNLTIIERSLMAKRF